MTSSLRRKRQITARPTTAARTLTSLLALGWLAAAAPAQTPPSALKPLPTAADLAAPPKPVPKTLYFQKDAAPTPLTVKAAVATSPAAAAKPSIVPTRYQAPDD